MPRPHKGQTPPPMNKSYIKKLLHAGLLDISEASVDALLKAGLSLDEGATRELMHRVYERLQAWIQATKDLEHKMHIMIGADIAVLLLLWSRGLEVAPAEVYEQLGLAWLWPWHPGMLVLAALCALLSLGLGLFGRIDIELAGTDPRKWGMEYLTADPDATPGASNIRGKICVRLMEQCGRAINKCSRIYNKKLGHYRRGVWCNCILLLPALPMMLMFLIIRA